MFLSLGVYELTHNNKTVSLRTINAVQQMSLYPELIASVLYQATGSNVCAFLFIIIFIISHTYGSSKLIDEIVLFSLFSFN